MTQKKLLIGNRQIIRETSSEVFENALRLARANGEFKEIDAILDYTLADTYRERILTMYEFDTLFTPNYGCSEGIYIDACICGCFDERNPQQCESLPIGTLKTLRTDLEAMKLMGQACGVLTHFARQYVNDHLERFTPKEQLLAEAARQQEAERQQQNG